MTPFYVVIAVGICIFAATAALAMGWCWLETNWWLPRTKTESNGISYRVLQLNILRLWQEVDRLSSPVAAAHLAEFRVNEWHEIHNEFRPLTTPEKVAAELERRL